MRTFKQQLKQTLTLSLFTVFLASNPLFAEPNAENKHEGHEGHHAPSAPDWLGTYQGFLPCADCAGMKTTVALNKNNTYMIIYQYSGKSEREYVEKGSFAWTNKDKVIELTPKKGGAGETRLYYVGDNSLIQLDASGNRITGKLAEKYVLRRYDVTQSTPASGGHGGH